MGQQQSTQAHGGTMGQQQSTQAHGDTPDCDLEIFLIGKTGHGKSATGNTILGEKGKFKTSNIQESATLSTDVGWTNRDGLTVKVVDGPGLLDTRMKSEGEQISQMQTNLSSGFLHCPYGFHALVLVLSYCGRFTDEEKKIVAVLKGMLGASFIRDHCIVAFTHGENFAMEEPEGNFKDWCRNQTGDLRNLLDECNNRVVLFHNLTLAKWEESTKELISLARRLGRRYTAEMFTEIAAERIRFIEQHGAIQLRGLIQSKINMIISCLKKKEKGALLDKLLNDLEEEVRNEPFHWDTVREIKKGIQQSRNMEYQKARETFETIELQGKSFLQQFLNKAEIIVKKYLRPGWEVAKRLYKLVTGK